MEAEAQDIAGDEYNACLAWSHTRKRFATHGADEARVDHVKRCGEQDGREDEEGGLDNVDGK